MKKLIKKYGMVAIVAILLITTGGLIMVAYKRGLLKKKSGEDKKPDENLGSDQARGIRNNNPLNLRRTEIDWKHERKIVTDKEYEEFESMMWGLRAGLRNMRTKIQQGYKTLNSLIAVWAPPSENNTEKYIHTVAELSGYATTEELVWEKEFMFPIVAAMCKIESRLELTKDLYDEAWENI